MGEPVACPDDGRPFARVEKLEMRPTRPPHPPARQIALGLDDTLDVHVAVSVQGSELAYDRGWAVERAALAAADLVREQLAGVRSSAPPARVQ